MLTQETVDRLNAPYVEEAKRKQAEATVKQPEDKPAEKVVEQPITKAEASPETKEEVKKDTPASITDETAIEFLRSKGIDVSSLDEIARKEAPKKTEDEETAEVIEFGVKNKNLKVDDFLNAKKVKEMPDRDVVFGDFASKQKAKDKKVSDETIVARFNKKYGEEVETNDIDADGNTIKQTNFDDDAFTEDAQKIRSRYDQPIEDVKKEYTFIQQTKKEVSQLQSKIPKQVQVEYEGEKYDIELDAQTAEQLRQELNDSYSFHKQTTQGKTKYDLDRFLEYSIWSHPKRRADAIAIISNSISEKKVSEALKPYKNQQVAPMESAGAAKPVFDEKAQLAAFKAQRSKMGM